MINLSLIFFICYTITTICVILYSIAVLFFNLYHNKLNLTHSILNNTTCALLIFYGVLTIRRCVLSWDGEFTLLNLILRLFNLS